MKKALILASVASMIDQFNRPSIRILQEQGYEVHVAANMETGSTCSPARVAQMQAELAAEGVVCHHVDFSRNILHLGRLRRAYRQVKALLLGEGFSLIHCHSPIGGAICRFVARNLRKTGTRVFYTAHGFHFYRGAPLLNWLVYYPIEKYCARHTDLLLTINREDYALAKKRFRRTPVAYIPGVGVDLSRFAVPFAGQAEKREEYGIPANAFLLLSVGELNRNKNHITALRAMAEVGDPRLYYAIAGLGAEKEHLATEAARLGLADRLLFLGYRPDIAEWYQTADLFLFPSQREGLGLAAVEAMAASLPVIAGENRGTREFSEGGAAVLCPPTDVAAFSAEISRLMQDADARRALGEAGCRRAADFSREKVNALLRDIYEKVEKSQKEGGRVS